MTSLNNTPTASSTSHPKATSAYGYVTLCWLLVTPLCCLPLRQPHPTPGPHFHTSRSLISSIGKYQMPASCSADLAAVSTSVSSSGYRTESRQASAGPSCRRSVTAGHNREEGRGRGLKAGRHQRG